MEKECNSVQSNEEIIHDLTRNLEGACVKEETSPTSVDDNADSDKNTVWEDARENVTEDTNANENTDASNTNDLSNDFVDEELLKDRDVTLSEDEKQKLKEEAEKLKNEGNELFKGGSYLEAILQYTQGLQTCPLAYSKERSILYANRAAAKSKTLEKNSAIEDCTKAIELNDNYTKAYIRRAQLYEETEKLDEALEDYKKVLTFDPSHTEANYAVRRLPPLIQERNEKLKDEMLNKLTVLANMALKPFGLSTNNFQLEKDAGSGSYSVKFQQNPS